jgi:hypothetical protein
VILSFFEVVAVALPIGVITAGIVPCAWAFIYDNGFKL